MTLFVVPTAARCHGWDRSHAAKLVLRSNGTAPSGSRGRSSGVIRSTTGLDVIIVPRREMLDAPFASLEVTMHTPSTDAIEGASRARGRARRRRNRSRPATRL